jgi:hypothetical protein
MADVQKLSERVIDLAERVSDMADAAQGKRRRGGGVMSRWFLLPAAGAGIYALAKSDAFSRQAKEVVDEAKTRASDLPDELVNRVRTTTSQAPNGNAGRARRRTQSTRKAGSKRKTAAAR